MSELTREYDELLAEATASGGNPIDFLRRGLSHLWYEAYGAMLPQRVTNVCTFTHGTFDYIYDDYASLEAIGAVRPDGSTEARLVAAIGCSQPNLSPRDDSRLRGWVGPTDGTFGGEWDKGHFIAHSIGGAVDGLEANVFLQLRRVNRGGYRRIERYCAKNPGVLCFSRPIYADSSARPVSVELGVLMTTGKWWIEVFENSLRHVFSRGPD